MDIDMGGHALAEMYLDRGRAFDAMAPWQFVWQTERYEMEKKPRPENKKGHKL